MPGIDLELTEAEAAKFGDAVYPTPVWAPHEWGSDAKADAKAAAKTAAAEDRASERLDQAAADRREDAAAARAQGKKR
jgi:hypothetical protein